MAEVSVKQAIAAGWASRATIYRAVADGKLSMNKAPDGRSMVETSELIRAFGEPRLKNTEAETNQLDMRHSSSIIETAVLKERMDGLERDRGRLERELLEAKEREAWLKQQLERQTSLLTQVTEGRRGWFGWVREAKKA